MGRAQTQQNCLEVMIIQNIIFLTLTSLFVNCRAYNLNRQAQNSKYEHTGSKEILDSWHHEGLLDLENSDSKMNFLNLPGRAGMKNIRSLSITNNLEILRDRLMREINGKRSNNLNQAAFIYGNGRERKSLGDNLDFLG